MKLCSITGCGDRSLSRGWCKKHYRRWERHDDPTIVMQVHGNDELRFWSRVNKTADCWEWLGAQDRDGYGVLWLRGRLGKAHRFAFESANGPIPDGLEPDHLCDNPTCVRPDHLEAVTHSENIKRAFNR